MSTRCYLMMKTMVTIVFMVSTVIPVGAQVQVLSEDFEQGAPRWAPDNGIWEVGTQTQEYRE